MKSDKVNSEVDSYNSIWSSKPWWCQPWSIVLFGLMIILLSWSTFHMILVTILFSLVILAWWILFLFIAPSIYLEQTNQSSPD